MTGFFIIRMRSSAEQDRVAVAAWRDKDLLRVLTTLSLEDRTDKFPAYTPERFPWSYYPLDARHWPVDPVPEEVSEGISALASLMYVRRIYDIFASDITQKIIFFVMTRILSTQTSREKYAALLRPDFESGSLSVHNYEVSVALLAQRADDQPFIVSDYPRVTHA